METGRVVKSEDKKPLRIISVLFDVTAQHNAQTELRESEERYRAIVSQTSVGIARIDLDATITFLNNKACDMFGTICSEIEGKKLFTAAPHGVWYPSVK